MLLACVLPFLTTAAGFRSSGLTWLQIPAAMALGIEPPEPGIMSRSPRPSHEGIFARGLGRKVFARVFILLLFHCWPLVWDGIYAVTI